MADAAIGPGLTAVFRRGISGSGNTNAYFNTETAYATADGDAAPDQNTDAAYSHGAAYQHSVTGHRDKHAAAPG